SLCVLCVQSAVFNAKAAKFFPQSSQRLTAYAPSVQLPIRAFVADFRRFTDRSPSCPLRLPFASFASSLRVLCVYSAFLNAKHAKISRKARKDSPPTRLPSNFLFANSWLSHFIRAFVVNSIYSSLHEPRTSGPFAFSLSVLCVYSVSFNAKAAKPHP
ncbi:MAG: hypothetical protein DYH05_04535, partial [Acidobacteria bacterium ACB1]|nr:hypothetical protein [Acidobacteria bacterium ACB1]